MKLHLMDSEKLIFSIGKKYGLIFIDEIQKNLVVSVENSNDISVDDTIHMGCRGLYPSMPLWIFPINVRFYRY